MSAEELDSLLEELEALPKGSNLRTVSQMSVPGKSSAIIHAVKQCALVRWFDQPLYEFLTNKITGKATFQDFNQSVRLQRMGPGRFAIDETERARLLEEWQADDSTWRKWNLKIGEYFANLGDPDQQLCAVYHLAASPDPLCVKPQFEEWYRNADEKFDVAQCSGLLEMLRLQERFRGPVVSSMWREWFRYFQSRQLFADDYYKTESYFERADLFQQFRQVLEVKGEMQPWIFHIHATGGTGKTMFLRWLLSRYLTVQRIPCARVDFDDFKPLNDVIDRPLRLFVRVIEQWSQQIDGLDSLLEKLNREETNPGWNVAVMEEIKLQLEGAKLIGSLVISLDTLEETTLFHAAWLRDCINTLRDLRTVVPGLTLILSGRYDIAQRSKALLPSEFIGYEIPRFSKTEAHAYLERRGIPAGKVRDAIVDRAGEDDDPSQDDSRLEGRNPFKLAIFAEIVLNSKFTAEKIRKLPRADVAYLLERVILRIESQPLRWMIRYGAIARRLTPEFMKHVLLPHLRLALRGEVGDQPANDLDQAYQSTWICDPELAKGLRADNLWEELKKYARDRGWISLITIDGKPCLRFHPDVVKPTCDLLMKQDIFPELQQRASSYFQKISSERKIPEADSVHAVQDAIFHQFQMQAWHDRRKSALANKNVAWDYWKQQLRRAARSKPDRQLKIARELLEPDYAEAQRIPVKGMLTVDQLCEVHCTVADVLLQNGGIWFAGGRNREEFLRHVEIAESLVAEHHLTSVSLPLATLAKAWRENSKVATQKTLRAALKNETADRWRFIYTLHVAQLLAEKRLPDAVQYFREALQLWSSAEQTGVDRASVSLELAAFYAFEGEHTAVINTLTEARRHAKDNPCSLARVLQREASHALAVGDLETAAARTSALLEVPTKYHSTRAAHTILAARLSLANAEPTAALKLIKAGRKRSVDDHDVASLKDQEGEALAALLEFNNALQLFEEASVSYDVARVKTGPARCKVLSARLLAAVMHNYREVDAVLESAKALPGFQDAEIGSDVYLIEAFTAKFRGQQKTCDKILEGLLKQRKPPWPPALRAKILMFALLSAQDLTPDLFEELIETLSDVQPPTLRDRALDWVSHFKEPVEVPDHFIGSLMPLFARSRPGSASGVRRAIRRADLLRLLGQQDAAQKQILDCERLAKGIKGEAALILEWELNEARRRLNIKTVSGPLAKQASSTPLASTTLHDVMRFAAARESHRLAEARSLRKLPSELGNVFEAERLSWLASLPDATPKQQAAAQSYRETLGWTETAPMRDALGISLQAKSMSATLLKAADNVPETIGRLLKDWRRFADDLSLHLTKSVRGSLPETVAMEPEIRLSSLPWEIATVARTHRVVHRTSMAAPRANYEPQPVRDKRSVIYAGQSEGRADSFESFSASSGGSIVSFYRPFGVRPYVVKQAQPTAFEHAMKRNSGVTLIHIACTLRETTSGAYLDFEGTRTRAMSFGTRSVNTVRDTGDLYLGVTNLDRALQNLDEPPFLVLDVANPFNLTEAVRILLLRNRFAAQLFNLGHVRGILGCGLALPDERYHLSRATVKSLMTGTIGETLNVLRSDESKDLEAMLPRFGAALWTNQPTDRLFKRGPKL